MQPHKELLISKKFFGGFGEDCLSPPKSLLAGEFPAYRQAGAAAKKLFCA
jgi:hypothetical protein